MTIITKPKTDKKQQSEKAVEKPLVFTDVSVQGSECIDVGVVDRGDLGRMEMEMWLSPSVRRRISTTTTVCVFITALLVMSICIIGGVYLYRQVTQHQRMSRFRGWCGIPFEKDTLHFAPKDYRLGPNTPFFKEDSHAEWLTSHNRFREEFDIDLDSELYERIDVPDFGYGRSGQFIHDFKTNKTAIIDLRSKRCFVMPLDRKYVKPPRDMFDLVSKLWTGYYNVDTSVVRKTMKVIQSPIEDLNTQGSYIAEHCVNFPTFPLVEINQDDEQATRKRRSVEDEDGTENYFSMAEFAGQNILEYTIFDA